MYIKTFGCDPEVFLKHKQTGEFISSVGLIGGSKDFPMPIGQGCAVQEDNVAVEFNTPPCATAEAFIGSINYNLSYLRDKAESLGLELCIQPSAKFSDVQLDSHEAKEFGCEPDFNAWKDGEQNPRPHANDPNLRSAGGHIHVSVPDGMDRLDVVKAMDLFVGCMMLEFDTDQDRRQLYGRAGACRFKEYGVEYRTASNMWISSDARIRWAWDQTEKALAFVSEGNKFDEYTSVLIQKCINESDLGCLEQLKDMYDL